MRLYNTLTRREEEFAPARNNTVRMYACGLTVYARGHIGNFRTFVCLDVLRRTLKYAAGFDLKQVVNFTDIDDKTINASRAAGVTLREYTDTYINAFRKDAAALGLEPVEEYPRATDEGNLRAMVDTVKALEKRGHTYRSDGSIYFKIDTFPEYGKLARLDHDGIKSGARIDADQYEKQDARDFVLWKATRLDEPTWDFGVGPGRPGWHIECSTMALRFLGEPPIDIHAGGVDLIFPHHENEIAQAEGATGTQFSRFWVHIEHLLLDRGGKMSKSLGNVFTVRDVLDRGHRASTLPLRADVDALSQATSLHLGESGPGRGGTDAADGLLGSARPGDGGRSPHRHRRAGCTGTRGVRGEAVERPQHTGGDRRGVRAGGAISTPPSTRMRSGQRTSPRFEQRSISSTKCSASSAFVALKTPPRLWRSRRIERLIEARQAVRRRLDFAAADRIRDDLDARGIQLEDRAGGTRWKRK